MCSGRDFYKKAVLVFRDFVWDRSLYGICFDLDHTIFRWDVVNYFAGMCGFRFRDYILGTIIGIIPASLTYNLIGASLGKPLDPIRIAMITATVILTIAITLLYLKFGKRSQT